MFQTFKKNLIAGLVILLPLAITFALISFLINLFTDPFVDLVSSFLVRFNLTSEGFLFLSSDQMVRYFSKFLILVFLFLITLVLGFLTRWFVVHTLFSLTDKLVKKIPVINTIYKTSQEITKTLFRTDQTSFRHVVLVPYPHKGIYALGLVAGETPQEISSSPMISVLVPTAPVPTSGFLILAPPSDLIYLDIKPEDAIKFVVSLGVVSPQLGSHP